MKYLLVISVLASSFLFSGCATITKDDSQPVAFSSDTDFADILAERQIERQMRASEKHRWTDPTINTAGNE